MNIEKLKTMNFETGKAYLEENGFWESATAVDEEAKGEDVYFANEDDKVISFVTVYSKMERAEDGSWDTEIEKEYWEEV